MRSTGSFTRRLGESGLSFSTHWQLGRWAPFVNVTSVASGKVIGQIRWDPRESQFCLRPFPGSRWGIDRLTEIQVEIRRLTAVWGDTLPPDPEAAQQ